MVVIGHRKATTRWSFDCCISHVTQERVSQLIKINKKGLLGTHNAEVNEQLWRDIARCLFSMVQLPELRRWGLKLITWEGHNVLHRWSGRKEESFLCWRQPLRGETTLPSAWSASVSVGMLLHAAGKCCIAALSKSSPPTSKTPTPVCAVEGQPGQDRAQWKGNNRQRSNMGWVGTEWVQPLKLDRGPF